MDRRTNNRQRPAGNAAGRRGPPQHHYHQHNNASWGDLVDEENQKLCHIIKKKKDQIKRLEELLEARDRGFSSEFKKSAERVCELETQNYDLTLSLQRQEKNSKQQFEEMLAKYEAERQTASNHIKQVLRQEVESQVRSEYQQKETQMEKQIHQMGAELQKIGEEKQSLLLTLADAHTAVTSKDAALQQSEEAWQAKYEALTEKMEENTRRCETQVNEFTIKASLMEEQIHQRDLEILRLTEDNSCLANKLAETAQELTSRAAELLQSQRAWEETLQTVKDNFYKEAEESQQSWESQQTQVRVKVEAEIQQKDAEILRLTEDNNGLIEKLSEKTEELTRKDDELLQSQRAWEETLQTVKDNFYKEAEESQQSWESQQTQVRVKVEAEIQQKDAEILRLTEDNNSLIEKLSEKTEELTRKDDELLQSQRAWEETLQTVKDNFYKEAEESQQSWESQQTQVRVKVEAEIQQKDAEILRLTEDNNSLIEKLSEKTEELSRKDDELLQSQRAWEETLQTVKDNFYKEAEESQQSWESQQTQVRVKVEAEIQQKDAEILRLTKDNNSLIEKLSEKTEELTRKDDELLQSQRAWEETLQTVKDNFYKEAEESQQSWESQQTQVRVKVEAEIQQKDAEILRLTEDNNSLIEKLSEKTEELSRKDDELLQSQRAWEETLQTVKDNFYKEAEESQQSWESQQTQVRVKVEAEIQQKDAEILRLTEDNNSLIEKLSEKTEELTRKDDELLQSQRAWEETLQTVKDNFYKEAEESQQSWESQQTQVRVKVEAEIQQKDAEILRLTEDNNSLIEKLSEKTEELTRKDDELLQSQRAWEETLQTVKDNFYKEAEESQQSWESQQTQVRVKVEAEIQQKDAEILHLTEDNNSLIEKLSEKTEELTRKDDELLQSQRAWEETLQTVKDNFYKEAEESQQSWESQQTQVRVKVEAEIQQKDAEILRLTEDNNSLIEKLSEKTEELTRKDDELLQSQRAWEEFAEKHQAEVKQLMDEKVELEDLCLYVNKKRKRFLLFPRRSSDDRETQLQKMKNKMQQKAAKAKRS